MARRPFFLLLVVSLVVTGALSQKKKKKSDLPAAILQARYVMVTTYNGNDLTANVHTDDRNAMVAVEDAIREWGRYALTYQQENADLIILVRKGRLVGATVGGRTRGTQPGSRGGIIFGTDSGHPDDTLAIYDARLGIDTSPLWRRTLKDGLSDDLPLFQHLKQQIKEAEQKKP
jgi:hypothetical protein